jgi:hypothetical protein
MADENYHKINTMYILFFFGGRRSKIGKYIPVYTAYNTAPSPSCHHHHMIIKTLENLRHDKQTVMKTTSHK